jgi:arsenical pump membrane protein
LAEAVALAALAATLAFAVARPYDLPEALVAVPAALVLVTAGLISLHDAWHEVRTLLPTVAFLAAVLVLGELCEREGLFEAAGRIMGHAARGRRCSRASSASRR